MGMMDDTGDMSQDQLRTRIAELSNMEQSGQLNDTGRAELARLRSRL